MGDKIKVVLLDLGGVLLRLHDPLAAFGINLRPDVFLEKWLLSEAVRKLERGELDAQRFASEMVQEFALPYESQEFLHRFERWPDALFEGVPDLLKKLAANYHLALLSNTNVLHWERDDFAGQLEPLMHSLFLSFRTGLLKPEADAFNDVLSKLEVAAGEVLFLDDNVLNIDAARQCGIQARLTRGFDMLTENLSQAGVTTC